MTTEVLVIGAGGHARVVADALRASGATVVGFAEVAPVGSDVRVDGVRVFPEVEALRTFSPERVMLANGVGSVGSVERRRQVHERFTRSNWRMATVIHPRAIVSEYTRLESGAQVMAGAIVQAGASIGVGSIVNTGAVVDHDCRIGAHCHIASGAVLSGNVELGDSSHVGTGAVIIQGITLGACSIVGAGAVVIRSHPGAATLIGVPASERGKL